MSTFTGSLSTLWPSSCFASLINLSHDPLQDVHVPLCQVGVQLKVSGKENCKTYGLVAVPCLLTPKESFCARVVSPLPQGQKKTPRPDPFLKQSLVPLCGCHDCYLQVSTGDKAWLFILFPLLFLFWRINRRVIINA